MWDGERPTETTLLPPISLYSHSIVNSDFKPLIYLVNIFFHFLYTVMQTVKNPGN
jgi:hypothetical protein